MEDTTRDLLAKYAMLLNDYGTDSKQALEFVQAHTDDVEFLELAELSLMLKKALTSPCRDRSQCYLQSN